MSAGYIYVLVNSSMPDLVKVGKTTRSVSDRADELSCVTGVATPFVVAYEEFFRDCDGAEEFIHTKLTQKGLRISDSREFFRASPTDVIKVIASLKVSLEDDNKPASDGAKEPRSAAVTGPRPWAALLEEGLNYQYGLDGYLEDPVEALKCYRGAAQLGSGEACEHMAFIYEVGNGVNEDAAKAIELYREGIRKSNYYCYAGLAKLYSRRRHQQNANKAILLFLSEGESDNWQRFYPRKAGHELFHFCLSYTDHFGHLDPEVAQRIKAYTPDIADSGEKYLLNQGVPKSAKVGVRELLALLQRGDGKID